MRSNRLSTTRPLSLFEVIVCHSADLSLVECPALKMSREDANILDNL